MKNNKEKKKSTIGLWLLLIVLLATAAGLTYLKYFYNEKIYYPEDIKLNSEIEEQLNEITNNFNKDTLTLEKLKENIVIEAKLQNDTIVVNYKEKNNEPVGDLKVKTSELKGITVEGDIIPKAIDELPLLAILGACASGKTTLKDAQELRKKESDRISSITTELKKLGIEIEEKPDGFTIEGKQKFKIDTDKCYT